MKADGAEAGLGGSLNEQPEQTTNSSPVEVLRVIDAVVGKPV